MRSGDHDDQVVSSSITSAVNSAKVKLSSKSDKVFETIRSGRVRKLRHKACFVFSFFDLVLSVYLFSTAPGSMFTVYSSVKMTFLIVFRFILYRWKSWHYYMFDLCYYVYFLTVVDLVMLYFKLEEQVEGILWEGVQGETTLGNECSYM